MYQHTRRVAGTLEVFGVVLETGVILSMRVLMAEVALDACAPVIDVLFSSPVRVLEDILGACATPPPNTSPNDFL